jgi:hypothetical protein
MFVMNVWSLPTMSKVLSFASIAGIAIVDVISSDFELKVMVSSCDVESSCDMFIDATNPCRFFVARSWDVGWSRLTRRMPTQQNLLPIIAGYSRCSRIQWKSLSDTRPFNPPYPRVCSFSVNYGSPELAKALQNMTFPRNLTLRIKSLFFECPERVYFQAKIVRRVTEAASVMSHHSRQNNIPSE